MAIVVVGADIADIAVVVLVAEIAVGRDGTSPAAAVVGDDDVVVVVDTGHTVGFRRRRKIGVPMHPLEADRNLVEPEVGSRRSPCRRKNLDQRHSPYWPPIPSSRHSVP